MRERPTRTAVVRLMIAVVLSVLAVGVPVTSAAAAVTPAAACSGASCAGWDPVSKGCNAYSKVSAGIYLYNATDKAYDGPQVATLVNWYSNTCNANWTQSYLSSYAISHGYGLMIYTISSADETYYPNTPATNNQGKTLEYWNGQFYYGSAAAYTDMVDGTSVTSSCIQMADANGNDINTGTYSTTSSSAYCVKQ